MGVLYVVMRVSRFSVPINYDFLPFLDRFWSLKPFKIVVNVVDFKLWLNFPSFLFFGVRRWDSTPTIKPDRISIGLYWNVSAMATNCLKRSGESLRAISWSLVISGKSGGGLLVFFLRGWEGIRLRFATSVLCCPMAFFQSMPQWRLEFGLPGCFLHCPLKVQRWGHQDSWLDVFGTRGRLDSLSGIDRSLGDPFLIH